MGYLRTVCGLIFHRLFALGVALGGACENLLGNQA
jgi:hypothetical protein